MIKDIIKKIIPDDLIRRYHYYNAEKIKKQVAVLPLLSENGFKDIIINRLKIQRDDTVFIHSSVDRLNLAFPFYRIIPILLDIVGEKGTILFPTYPKLTSYNFLKTGEVFDVRRTATYTGLLNEFARRYKGAVRSLHPTKSVVAIGLNAKNLTSTHHESEYPYDYCSPYYKISQFKAKIIGLGVKTTYLSAVHVIDDTLKDQFPVFPFHPQLFNSTCINYDGEKQIVRTYAHDMKKMGFILPDFFRKNIPSDICEDIEIEGMRFFRADSFSLFEKMTDLALNDKITIYDKKFYKQ